MQVHSTPYLALPATVPDASRTDQPEAVDTRGFEVTEDWGRRRLAILTTTSVRSTGTSRDLSQLLQDVSHRFQRQSSLSLQTSFDRTVGALIETFASNETCVPSHNEGFAIAEVENDRVLIAAYGTCTVVVVRDDAVTIVGDSQPLPEEPSTPNIGPLGVQKRDRCETFEASVMPGDKVGLIPCAGAGNGCIDLATTADWSLVSAELEHAESSLWIQPRSIAERDSAPLLECEQLSRVGVEAALTVAGDADHWVRPTAQRARGGLVWKPPAADSLRRYTPGSWFRPPGGLQTHLPRGVSTGQIALVVAALLVLVSGIGYAAASNRPVNHQTEVSPLLIEYQQAIGKAISESDFDRLGSILPGAEETLKLAEQANVDPAVTGAFRVQMLGASDALHGRLRLQDAHLVGRLPEQVADRDPQLLVNDGTHYVLADQCYALDESSLSLTPVNLSSYSIPNTNESSIFVTDGAGYAIASRSAVTFFDDSMTMTQTLNPEWPLSVDPRTAHTSMFDGRLYLLDPESGQIFVTDPDTGATSAWLTAPDYSLPADSVAMIIDGGIHVMYASGEIVSLYDGQVSFTSAIDPPVPGLQHRFVDLGEISRDFYVADPFNVKVIVFDHRTGESDTIDIGPDPLGDLDWKGKDAFANLTDLLVDELTGSIYWMADGALWRATLPG